ncbi:UNVERIFIED_CONTAM: Copia protein [Sesamum calycinum]|uniref:Copia protein n=1 Tax=Sesamum calycinum TaxID=2727403 RepID=A0AAW2MQJ3_9LAMI
MRAYTPGLYGTLISSVETHSITNPKLVDQSTFTLWHDRLGHPGKTMMYRIIENSNGHPLKDLKFLVKVLGGEDKEIKRKDIAWNATSMSFLDPRTNDSELEVQRIIHLQNVANRLPDAFIDTKKVTKSHILAENVPARLEVPEVTLTQTKASESQIRRKRGRPLGSKDANPRKRKEHIVSINHDANVSTSNVFEDKIPEVILSEDPKPVEIMDEDDNDPQTMEECQHRNDWKSWKKAIQDELDSLNKREVFGPIIPTPKSVKPVGYKWVFVRKRNEQNEVVRYKARLVAQGFTQKPGIDYTETYSPVVDATTLRFLISLSIIEQLKMQLMDVVTAYLYGSLDTDIYMRIPEGLKMPEALKSKPRHMYSIKLKRQGLTSRMYYKENIEIEINGKSGARSGIATTDSTCPFSEFVERKNFNFTGKRHVLGRRQPIFPDEIGIFGEMLQEDEDGQAVLPASSRVHLQRHNQHVVMSNGIVNVTLTVPGGLVTSITYKGSENLLQTQNKEDNRGYWDVVWTKPRGHDIMDKLLGTSYKVIARNRDYTEISFTTTWAVGSARVPLNVDKRYVMLRDSPGFYSYAVLERLQGWPAFDIQEARIVFKLQENRFHYMAMSDERQRVMPMSVDRFTGEVLDYPEAVLLTHPTNSELQGEMFISTHYAGEDLALKFQSEEYWKKVFGPVYIYLNSDASAKTNLSILWNDAKQRMQMEEGSWPYNFPLSKDYLKSNQRGAARGQLLVHDWYKHKKAVPGASAYVGLAPPGAVGSWQLENKGYQFWTQTDREGNFLIKNVIPGTYSLFAWVPGTIGDYKHGFDITISPGCIVEARNVVFEAPRKGATLWEIGVPDRTAAEFFIPNPDPKFKIHKYKRPIEKFDSNETIAFSQ